MADYVNRQALLDVCATIRDNEWNKQTAPASWSDAYEDFIDIIEQQEAADVVSKETHDAVQKALVAFAETDVVQVVRCGKCNDYMPKSGICWRRSFPMSPDDYCSKGTRRAE